MSNHRTLLQDMKRGINCRLEAIAAIESLEAEVEEQARLLGASASREAELLARVEALEKDFAYHAELCTSQQARIGALTAEVEEQARLLGASGSREVELLARIEALEKAARGVVEARGIGFMQVHKEDVPEFMHLMNRIDKLAALLEQEGGE